MRLFVGINFEDKQQNQLLKMQAAFLPHMTNGRQTPVENLHCTLLFLGDTDSDKLGDITKKLAETAKRHSPFLTGFWDTAHFANGCTVVKLKCDKKFAALQSDIENTLDTKQNEKGKFLPHVTLLKKSVFDMPFREVKKNVPIFNVPFEVRDFTLFLSEFTPDGMVYTPLTFFKLGV